MYYYDANTACLHAGCSGQGSLPASEKGHCLGLQAQGSKAGELSEGLTVCVCVCVFELSGVGELWVGRGSVNKLSSSWL